MQIDDETAERLEGRWCEVQVHGGAVAMGDAEFDKETRMLKLSAVYELPVYISEEDIERLEIEEDDD